MTNADICFNFISLSFLTSLKRPGSVSSSLEAHHTGLPHAAYHYPYLSLLLSGNLQWVFFFFFFFTGAKEEVRWQSLKSENVCVVRMGQKQTFNPGYNCFCVYLSSWERRLYRSKLKAAHYDPCHSLDDRMCRLKQVNGWIVCLNKQMGFLSRSPL